MKHPRYDERLLSLARKLHATVVSIGRLHTSPWRLFFACVVGAIVGSTPLFGLHLTICVGLAALLRLNVVATYGAANVSLPPFLPLLGPACVGVGSKLLYGQLAPFDRTALTATSPLAVAPRIFWAWLVGAPFVGGVLGAVLGAIAFLVASRRATEAADPFALELGETLERYRASKRSVREYVRWKTRLDPVYRAIATELPDGITIVDLGTGLATLPILLALLGTRRTLVGIEHDEFKLAVARLATYGLPITLVGGDVRTTEIPPCDVITLVDVLHYFPVAEQRALLSRAVEALRPGGRLLVRETDLDAASGSTRALERLAVALGWNRAEATFFRSASELVQDLEALGLIVERRSVAGKLHPGNVLLSAHVPAGAVPRANFG